MELVRNIPVRVIHEVCKKCDKFKFNDHGVNLLWDGIRGLPILYPHCEHEDICSNLLKLLEENKNDGNTETKNPGSDEQGNKNNASP